MKTHHKFLKSFFDYFCSITLLIVFFLFIIILIILASISTNSCGVFTQIRVGYKGKLFKIYKIRTMKSSKNKSTITLDKDKRITRFGYYLRKTKLDELPQLINIIKGDMSFVGPRPDVPGYADLLTGHSRLILTVKPGITGPAQLHYSNEAQILSKQSNPELYNKTVIWPQKVALNLDYVKNYTIFKDFQYLVATIIKI